MQHASPFSTTRGRSVVSACLLIASSALWCGAADAGPRRNQRQPELDYHQPAAKPGSNLGHDSTDDVPPATEAARSTARTAAATGCANPIACENLLPGNPPSEWSILEPGDASIQGFATDQSFNVGATARFKVRAATTYRIDIYRAGWYQGNGARRIVTLPNIAPQTQPACRADLTSTTGLIDCGNWAVSASWTIPADAVSGVYFARLVRNDTGGSSYAFFNVRNDASQSDIVYQTSDTTRAAYNTFGGNSLYQCTVLCPLGTPLLYKGAYKVSFNRPNTAVSLGMQYSFFGAEFELVEFLEANGYDVTYISGVDTDRLGSTPLSRHKLFISSGHDEYWSGAQRTNVEAARDGGVQLAFFSGNEVFWKTRYENSIDGSNAPYRTLVTYKETHFDAVIDPLAPIWTGMWRDGRFSPPGDGGRPENALTGTAYTVDPPADFAMKVPAADGKMRIWRNTPVATQAAGETATLAPNTLGYEWDEDLDNGFRPAGIVHLSTNSESVTNHLIDVGNNYNNGVATHHMTLHRAGPKKVLVFSAGTIQWSWGLEGSPDGTAPADVRMQQATINLLADMGLQATTLIAGLTPPTASSDATAPVSTITSPAPGMTIPANSVVNIIGTASDSGGGVVGGVEISTDGGTTWHPVNNNGRESWIYQWIPLEGGSYSLLSRAVDDSANLGAPSDPVSVTVTTRPCPCSIWPSIFAPIVAADADSNPVEVGVKFYSDTNGTISGIRFFKGPTNTGVHVASLWTANGQLLRRAQFTAESASGWQQVDFAPVAITANTHYVASYHTNTGHYAGDTYYFLVSGFDNPPLHALRSGVDGGNGVYMYGPDSVFPANSFRASSYWIDVVFNRASTTTPLTIWPQSAVPAVTADLDTRPVELGVKFRADTPGRITGLRFYKSPGNTGTHVANLWTVGGTLLATAVFSNETASGWQQVNFATPINIAANTTYVASYHTNTGHYSDDVAYFLTQGVDSGPLHALRDGADGLNGVYNYGSVSVFPNRGWLSSNYWVDVVFEAGP